MTKHGNDQETKHKPQSQNSHQTWTHQRNQNERQYKTRRGPISDRICHTNRWNSQGTGEKQHRIANQTRNPAQHPPVDGRCVSHTPRPHNSTTNARYNKPRGKKYHIEFGAAKCKVVKIGPGPKNKITLNNTTLEEVPKYKYIGKVYNSNGNFEKHIKETENKITAAMQKILSETGDKEFKGMGMKAIWQCTEATVVPIMTYSSESWDPTKKEQEQPQKIFNTAIKTSMNLPRGTPTTILLKEAGGRLNKKDGLTRYGNSHVKDKTS